MAEDLNHGHMAGHMARTLWSHDGRLVDIIKNRHVLESIWDRMQHPCARNIERMHLPNPLPEVSLASKSMTAGMCVRFVDVVRFKVSFADASGFALRFADVGSFSAYCTWREEHDGLRRMAAEFDKAGDRYAL